MPFVVSVRIGDQQLRVVEVAPVPILVNMERVTRDKPPLRKCMMNREKDIRKPDTDEQWKQQHGGDRHRQPNEHRTTLSDRILRF